jgi:two-component system response regulator (stage 0 sporulation protein F)
MEKSERLILVADDQLGVRRLIQEVFREDGYRVLLASNGQEAVTAARSELPGLALLDMKMPVMDGLEALRLIKDMHPETIVLMMTAVGEEDWIQEALNSGAHRCISKPFDIFALKELVEHVLQGEG